MMFLEEIRPLIEMKFPGQTFAEISQIAALMWQKLTDDEKNEYKKAAEGLYMSRSNLRTHERVHSDSGDGNENGEASSGDESDEEGSETSQDGSGGGGDADMGDDDDDAQQR